MNADELVGDHRPGPEPGSFILTVDGEVFTVTPSHGRRCDYTWDSGPNGGYGFSSTTFVAGDSTAVPPLLTIEQHRESIRDFLSSINPETGYLD
jgi:hypothetical protein